VRCSIVLSVNLFTVMLNVVQFECRGARQLPDKFNVLEIGIAVQENSLVILKVKCFEYFSSNLPGVWASIHKSFLKMFLQKFLK
jgi:hypothetical protein